MKASHPGGARLAVRAGVLLAVSFALLLTPAPVADAARMLVAAPLRPLQWLAARSLRTLGGWLPRWGVTDGTDRRAPSVRDLTRRVERLETELAHQKELLRDALRKLDALRQAAARPLEPVALADVIAYDASDWRQSMIVDRGRSAGVRVGMVALWGGALVGRVVAVGPFCSRVRLITEPASRVAVRSARSRAAGLLHGTGLDTCRVKYVGYQDDIRKGDRIVTAGMDGLFPAHLVVGTCVRSDRSPGELMRTVLVRPAVSPRKLESVLIVRFQPPDRTLLPPTGSAARRPDNAPPG